METCPVLTMSARPPAPSEVRAVDRILERKYRSADLGNLSDPLAEIVYIILSRQTRESVYQAVFEELRNRFPMWLAVLDAHPDDLLAVITRAGFQNQRLGQLLGMLRAVRDDNLKRGVGPAKPAQDLTLAYLAEMADGDAEAFLRGLPGVGFKTARCVMSYSLDRPAFAVDTHVERVLTRLGWLPPTTGRLRHDDFQDIIPTAIRRRLHVNLVHHGRAVCRTRTPVCGACTLEARCAAAGQGEAAQPAMA